MTPELLAQAFAEGKSASEAEQIEAECNQHQICKKIEEKADWCLAFKRQTGRAQSAGHGAGHAIGQDTPGVIRQVHRPACRRAERQRTDDAATHADTVSTTEQANQKRARKAESDIEQHQQSLKRAV